MIGISGCRARTARTIRAVGAITAVSKSEAGTAPAQDYNPIAQSWDFSHSHTVADLGGGGGALIASILHLNPHLHGILVDRPEFMQKAPARTPGPSMLSAERYYIMSP